MTIEDLYHDYITTVSSPDMTISLQTAKLLWEYAMRPEVTTILDLGSGLSSAILHLTGKSVCSYDDSPIWLERTKAFLEKHSLPTDNLRDALSVPAELALHDLVFHDFGEMTTRRDNLLLAAHATGQYLILDDVHFQPYNWSIRTFLDLVPTFQPVDVQERTTDIYGRYALVLERKRQ